MKKFIMTESGRIMLRTDYEREQATALDRARYEQREKLNREWRIAPAATAGKGPGEQCGTPGCVNDARWIPVHEGNSGSRVYRCTQCCEQAVRVRIDTRLLHQLDDDGTGGEEEIEFASEDEALGYLNNLAADWDTDLVPAKGYVDYDGGSYDDDPDGTTYIFNGPVTDQERQGFATILAPRTGGRGA